MFTWLYAETMADLKIQDVTLYFFVNVGSKKAVYFMAIQFLGFRKSGSQPIPICCPSEKHQILGLNLYLVFYLNDKHRKQFPHNFLLVVRKVIGNERFQFLLNNFP